MNKQIFVNLPVKNLEKSKAFFAALGYTFNPQFTDENAASMVIQDGSIYAMLLVEDFLPHLYLEADRQCERSDGGAGLPVVREPRGGR